MFKKIKSGSLLLVFLFYIASLFVPPVLAFAQTATIDQSISLKSGFNFVSFTVTPPATPSEFKSKDLNIEDIYLYSAAAGSFLSASEGTLTSLAVGKGYIIKSKADTSITINGPPAAIIGDITLKKGFNLLGFSKLSSSSPVNAFTKLMNASSAIAGIYKWSPAAGSFVQVIRDSEGNVTMLDGSDPSLKPGEAYFVNVSEDTKINYDDGVKLTKFFAGIYTDPNSDTVSAGGTYDLNKVKVYALYSDGSTVEVTSSAVFTASAGTISGRTYAAPKYSATAIIKVSYTETASGVSKECFFSMVISSVTSGAVKTTSYRCSYKLSPSAKVVDEEALVTYSVSSSEIVLTASSGVSIPAAGDVLIGYHGDGYLRKATAVTSQNGRVYVSTVQSNLEEAFETLDYSYKGKLSTLQASVTAAPGSPESYAVASFLRSKTVMPAPSPDRSIISKDNLKKIMDNVSITVSLTKADVNFDPVFECDIEIGWFKLKKFLFVVGGDLAASLEFAVEAKAKADLPIKSEIEIFHSTPHFFSIGPVPFSFEWDINCGVDASVSVTGSYNFSGVWKYGVRAGAQYSAETGTWTKINQITKTSSSENSYELKGALELKPYFNIGFAIKLAAVTGPKIYLEAYFLFLAEMTSIDKVAVTVSAGAGASASFVVEILSWTLAEFNSELFSFGWKIYEKTIDFFVAAPVITPAGGSYTADQTVEITCATQGAVIRYTTDGSAPSSSLGNIYSGPIIVSRSMTIKAVAYKSAAVTSTTASAQFAINDILFPETPESAFAFYCTKHSYGTQYCDDSCSEYKAYLLYASETSVVTVPASCTIKDKIRNVIEFNITNGNPVMAVKVSEGITGVYVQSNNYLKKIVLPVSVKNFVFSYCNHLNDVSIPYGVTAISENAFKACKSLASLDIPSSVTSIGDYAFQECVSLGSVTLPSSLTYIGCNSFLGTGLRSVKIPDSVTSIGAAAFNRTKALEEITFSINIKTLPEYTLSESSVARVYGLEGVTGIGKSAFTGCQNLKTVSLGKDLNKIGDMAFYNCGSLESIYFSGDAPVLEGAIIYLPNAIYFKAGTSGWTTPLWNGKNSYQY
jgi:hypothetical protein